MINIIVPDRSSMQVSDTMGSHFPSSLQTAAMLIRLHTKLVPKLECALT